MKKKIALSIALIALIAPSALGTSTHADASAKINTHQVQTYNSGRYQIYAKYMKANGTFAKRLSNKDAKNASKNPKLVKYNQQVHRFNVHVSEVTDGVRLTAENYHEQAEKAYEKVSSKENKLKGSVNHYKIAISRPVFDGVAVKKTDVSFNDWLKYQDGYYQDNILEWDYFLKHGEMTQSKYDEKMKPYRDEYTTALKKMQDKLASDKTNLEKAQKELADFRKKNDTNFKHYYGKGVRKVVSNKKGKLVLKFSAVKRVANKTFKPYTKTVKATFR
jgi:hypothetical protein